jgi:hypothetical protein
MFILLGVILGLQFIIMGLVIDTREALIRQINVLHGENHRLQNDLARVLRLLPKPEHTYVAYSSTSSFDYDSFASSYEPPKDFSTSISRTDERKS